eukprot:TRINITY_DN6714_c0_g1::TRINITY_DN6714_c0_g1_i1::g.3011::m.3011 TRINITY_DN6714_c0_g1::TRINITY_DN6714_c0_g1_i1::g.3011  ORF type:complete len:193 (+),score=18.20,sp/Q32M08/DUS4L_MOUSE/45.16/3e-51,Dus/PF01207.12/2.1e-35,Oxidored_FMN/PF00724.15/0.0002,His_biosynth/PF00977.16/3.1e+02,His_biosynth/PF00977.16/0.0013,TMP-TENI/PF02581.12/0.049,TMP-TENI/PF02581.12/1.8e+03 TRINITY_DN6714_c0_g1_i1:407-985(+)
MVRAVRERARLPLAVKIRIHSDLRETVELARQIEHAGAHWLTVHGRTPVQKSSQPVDYDAIALIKESVNIPVIANGDVFSMDDVTSIVDHTKVDGVMSARGILENPALYAGYDYTPPECVVDFLRTSLSLHANFHLTHHHLAFMMTPQLTEADRRIFTSLHSMPGVIDFLEDRLDMSDLPQSLLTIAQTTRP